MGNIPLLHEQASTFAAGVDLLFLALLGLSGLITAAIVTAILYFVVRYRRGSSAPRGPLPVDALKLEALWIVIPFVLSMGIYVWAAGRRRRRHVLLFLLLTMVLGIAFLGIKGFEWYQEYGQNLVPLPWLPFAGTGDAPRQVELSFNLYFVMTGLHALHLPLGVLSIGLFAAIVWRRPRVGERLVTQLELLGLYWHFVDVVWIFLFPLLYLIGGT